MDADTVRKVAEELREDMYAEWADRLEAALAEPPEAAPSYGVQRGSMPAPDASREAFDLENALNFIADAPMHDTPAIDATVRAIRAAFAKLERECARLRDDVSRLEEQCAVLTEVRNRECVRLRGDGEALRADKARLLEAVKRAYNKHVRGDDSIGWNELGDEMQSALCNAMGDAAFVKWLEDTDG